MYLTENSGGIRKLTPRGVQNLPIFYIVFVRVTKTALELEKMSKRIFFQKNFFQKNFSKIFRPFLGGTKIFIAFLDVSETMSGKLQKILCDLFLESQPKPLQ